MSRLHSASEQDEEDVDSDELNTRKRGRNSDDESEDAFVERAQKQKRKRRRLNDRELELEETDAAMKHECDGASRDDDADESVFPNGDGLVDPPMRPCGNRFNFERCESTEPSKKSGTSLPMTSG